MSTHGFFKTFIRYTISGGLATSVQFIVLILLIEYQLTTPLQASMIGAGCGFLVNYNIQFHWTFKVNGPHKVFFTRYLIVSATMFGLNAAIFWLSTIPEILALLQSIPYPEQIPLAKPKNIAYWYAQIIASAVVFLCNFLANRYYTFKPGKQSIPAQ
ncbi:MAG: GtrA family protein [Candidatus Methanofishera endochildressiae]|uniref:GtrA family protein n=1 Tax=Candidatus Methanofishera endochildressiae TaxID=2738884 RepID=A0A7Z0MP62_9GAMM|nr:GtrA family protein [Candidatus Methanofishera endochildressiae]